MIARMMFTFMLINYDSTDDVYLHVEMLIWQSVELYGGMGNYAVTTDAC